MWQATPEPQASGPVVITREQQATIALKPKCLTAAELEQGFFDEAKDKVDSPIPVITPKSSNPVIKTRNWNYA